MTEIVTEKGKITVEIFDEKGMNLATFENEGPLKIVVTKGWKE